MNKSLQIPPLNTLKVSVSNPKSGPSIVLDGASRALLGNPGEHCQMSYAVHDDGSATIELTSGHKVGPCISLFDDAKDKYRVHFPNDCDFAKLFPTFGSTPCPVIDVNGNNRIVFDLPAERSKALRMKPRGSRKRVEPVPSPERTVLERVGELLRELNGYLMDPPNELKSVEFLVEYTDSAGKSSVLDASLPMRIIGTVVRRELIG